MNHYLIERHIPCVETLTSEQLKEAAATSMAALDQLGPDIKWVDSFVTPGRTFCHYLARDEEIIREHARISGFPATNITLISDTISPATATS